MILCVHIVELDLLPWWQITEKYVVNGMSANIQLILIIAGINKVSKPSDFKP